MADDTPLNVGITGGIGSGKSLVCKIFQVLGIPVYDADTRARWLQSNDEELIGLIIKNFGNEAYIEANKLNRNFLAEKVFSNHEELNLLNQLVHPRVALDYQKWVAQHSSKPYVLKEAALLIESGAYRALDFIIHVKAPIDIRISRIRNRDKGRTEEQIHQIISKQLSDEERDQHTDYIIVNDHRSLLIPQVLHINQGLLSKCAKNLIK